MKLKIKSKEYGLHWGLGAIKSGAEVFGINEDALFLDSIIREYEYNDKGEVEKVGKDLRVRPELVFGALLNWCDENDEKYDGNVTNFYNAYNDADQLAILEDYKKSKYNGKVVDEIFNEMLAKFPKIESDEPKKKATSKRQSKTS